MRIRKLLIANRGEIAVRIINACREMGIVSVALYTDADSSWLARGLADEAVNIGAGAASDSYIDFDKVIQAAKSTGADAIHPGYGFLAENANFARRCQQEGIVFIGPNADVIDLMGNKAKAKALVESLSIPTIPGVNQTGLSEVELVNAANTMGYPVMLKAVAGGGGMGIRIIENEEQVGQALASVMQEAKSAFGDDRVIIEKYFPSVRHIEVQVLADQHGNAVHCFERECSVQRRRQKVLEEAPSVFINSHLRQKLCEASLAIVESVGYYSVGTVEYVVIDRPNSEEFYFLEMNTRLQVEHGVTEAVTGVDLVQHQISVAEGKALSLNQSDIVLTGHAIEARLCAEQPSNRFQPKTGTIHYWSVPESNALRVDTGIACDDSGISGTEISVYYDSLLAKLIASSPSRDLAIRHLQYGLQSASILGVETNQLFLLSILNDPSFITGTTNTTFIESHVDRLLRPLSSAICLEAALIAAMSRTLGETQYLHYGQGGEYSRTYSFEIEENTFEVVCHCIDDQRYELTIDQCLYQVILHQKNKNPPYSLRLAINGIEKHYRVKIDQQYCYMSLPGVGNVTATLPLALLDDNHTNNQNGYVAAMAGQVVSVLTQVGAKISKGDKLVVIESMKMEHSIVAYEDGVIEQIHVSEGSAVQSGQPLLGMQKNSEAA